VRRAFVLVTLVAAALATNVNPAGATSECAASSSACRSPAPGWSCLRRGHCNVPRSSTSSRVPAATSSEGSTPSSPTTRSTCGSSARREAPCAGQDDVANGRLRRAVRRHRRAGADVQAACGLHPHTRRRTADADVFHEGRSAGAADGEARPDAEDHDAARRRRELQARRAARRRVQRERLSYNETALA
jgi:hypothetical protein